MFHDKSVHKKWSGQRAEDTKDINEKCMGQI